MEVDKTIVILGIILLIVLGIFVLVQAGGSSNIATSGGASSAGQYVGGACGR